MDKLNYTFKDEKLLELAMTQSGVDHTHNNERLEFLGDRVLGLTVARLLFDMFPNEREGDLARRHSVLVSTRTLAQVAQKLGVPDCLHHGHITGGRINHILANAMEAVFGAIYLDGGFDAAATVITDIWRDLAARDAVAPQDAKSALQEYVQKNGHGELPIYEYKTPIGASHSPVFEVCVTAMGKAAWGRGASKKGASINAASALLKKLAISDTEI